MRKEIQVLRPGFVGYRLGRDGGRASGKEELFSMRAAARQLLR
jgi:hypothetical protein